MQVNVALEILQGTMFTNKNGLEPLTPGWPRSNSQGWQRSNCGSGDKISVGKLHDIALTA